MTEIRVEGAEKLGQVGARLKQIGDTELKKELLAGLRRAASPLTERARAGAATLPRKGGLDRFVGAAKFSVSSSTTAGNPRVRITAKLPGHDLGAIDRGFIRHPVFGNRQVWVEQKITPGWFTTPLSASAGPVRDELVRVIETIAAKAEHG